MLPDAVMQGLGWAPPPVDSSLAGAPVASAPLPPPEPVPVAPSWSPIPALAAPSTPPPPAPAPEISATPSGPDYPVPVSDSGTGRQPDADRQLPAPSQSQATSTTVRLTAPGQQRPVRVPVIDQQIARADASQDRADQASQQANASATEVQVAEADAQLENYKVNEAAHAKVQADLKAEQEDYVKTHAQKQAIQDSWRKQQMDYKVDQNQYMKQLGIGDKAGLFVGIALAGLGNAFLGMNTPALGAAKNPVIAMLQENIHKNIVAQEDERAQIDKKAGLAERDVDKYDAFSKDRQARILARGAEADRAVAAMVRMTAAKYAAPHALANGAKIAAELDQSAAKKEVEAAKRAADYDIEKRKLAIEQGRLNIALRTEQRQADEAKLQEQSFTPEQLKVLNPGLPVPPIGMTLGKYGDWLQTQKHGQQFLEAARGNDPAERMRQLSVPGIVTDKGEPILFRNPEQATKVGATKAIAEDMIRGIDEMRRLIKENGYEPKFWNSDAGQKARATFAHVLIQTKEADKLGVLTGPDMSILEKQIGTDDPGKFLSALAGIENFRHHTVQRFRSEVRNAVSVPEGSKLKDWEPPDPEKLPPPAETQEDIIRKVILGKPDADPGATYNPQLKRFEPNIPGLSNPNSPAPGPGTAAPYVERARDGISKKFPGVGAAQRALLESTWSRLASTDPAVKANAKELLEAAAKTASDDDVSDYAKQLLKNPPKYDVVPDDIGARSIAPPRLSPEVIRQLSLDATQ